MYALDTNSVSYFLKGRGRVAERLLAQPPSNVGLPSLVLYELDNVLLAPRPRPISGAYSTPSCGRCRCSPSARPEARAAAQIRVALEKAGKPIGPLDLLIAATALEQRAVLVTHNTKEFRRVKGLQQYALNQAPQKKKKKKKIYRRRNM